MGAGAAKEMPMPDNHLQKQVEQDRPVSSDWPPGAQSRDDPNFRTFPVKPESLNRPAKKSRRERVVITSFLQNSPLRSQRISVFIGLSTHSHVPMAHGGYATT